MPAVDASAPAELRLALDLEEVRPHLGDALWYEVLSGGLTNVNYRVAGSLGQVVVRVGATNAGLLAIDRRNERENSIRAARAGVGAPVYASIEEPSLLVIGFIEGTTLSAADLRRGHLAGPVADALRRLHSAEPFSAGFNMFDIQRSYLKIVDENGFWLPARYRNYLETFHLVEAALRAHPEPLVPCNNDLLAENFIESGGEIRIIDYEYSGNNEASFELGNIASESNLDTATLEQLCKRYWGREDPVKVARARLWGTVSKYGWTLWASIQSSMASLDFDFISWGMEKYLRAEEEFSSPELKSMIELVAP